jgi:hypothetical protein
MIFISPENHLPPDLREQRASSFGNDLLSHPVSRAVPSALESLTSGFEMEPGVPSPPISPKELAL